MTSMQLREAEIYAMIEPHGSEQGYIQAAIICSVIANVNRDEKKKPKPFIPEDFLPSFYRKVKKKQSSGEMREILSGMSTKGKRKNFKGKRKINARK